MNYELITIILTIITTQGALAAMIWSVHKDIAGLKERIAHLEGSMGILKDLFQSFVTSKTH